MLGGPLEKIGESAKEALGMNELRGRTSAMNENTGEGDHDSVWEASKGFARKAL